MLNFAVLQPLLRTDWILLLRQPIKPLQKQVCPDKYEVLMRLNLPNQISSPIDLINAAEKDDWMATLDRLIIEQAFKQIAQDTAHYSINLSAVTACDRDLANWVTDAISQYNIQPERITFELTETAVATNPEQIKFFAEFWRSQGGGFALDDFGSGNANLALLKSLPVSAVKLDRSIVANVATNQIDRLTVDYLVSTARLANATTIAEGIETTQLKVFLRELGVGYGQGWLIGMPELF